ncbi:MAG: DUF6491 family protein [Pseudomonadota bacterium]
MREVGRRLARRVSKTTQLLGFGLFVGLCSQTAQGALQTPESFLAPVERISNVETISDWRVLDVQRLALTVNSVDEYLLTLRDPCQALRYSSAVSVSASEQTIWAGFDAVHAGGEICRIKHIDAIKTRYPHSH